MACESANSSDAHHPRLDATDDNAFIKFSGALDELIHSATRYPILRLR
jgi:hypothetical protein